MSNTITITGNVVADAEVKFLPSGVAIASFTVADTPRIKDKATGEWKDGTTLFLRCNLWREAAENVAETITKGMRVVVTGHLKAREFESRDGGEKKMIELEVDEVGPSLKYARASVSKQPRSAGGQAQAEQVSAWGGGDETPPF